MNMESDVKFSWALLRKEYKLVFAGLVVSLLLLFLEKVSFLFGVVYLAFVSFLIVAAVLDYRYMLVFDKFLIVFALLFAVVYLFASSLVPHISEGFLCGLLCSGIFFVLRLINGGVGGGDIKFIFCLGLWLGVKLIFAIYAAVFTAMIFAVAVPKYRQRQARIPFAPFLSLGSAVAFVYGEKAIFLLEEYFL
ncbi:MAG: prepilin peptidase [Selenomonadaceae bacterium]|nr:prepilin peptidase [Selenomonadaceae bacterium]